MRKKRIHCFIAIRFGKNDTDAISTEIIAAVKELGLEPRQLNKIEHTENINLKILSELNDSDLVIADLTYARPSVYYEAGYAHCRKIPVIFTCRKDHFQNKKDFLKIHFDVDRYPIIPWENPKDISFVANLKSTLRNEITKLFETPLINDLNSYLGDIKKTLVNPDNLLRRMEELYSRLNFYPMVSRDDLKHDLNIENRVIIY